MSSANSIAHISSLSYRELQAECRKANLFAGGKTEELRQRLRDHVVSGKRGTDTDTEDDARQSKRGKKSPADDLTCPITLQLPFDPVTAEDGRVYERSAILSHFERHPTGLKSPITSEPMGRRLFPAVQTKNLIETLIDDGVIAGDLANDWKKKDDERKQVEDLKRQAEGGDADAMYEVGSLYADGEKGVTKDRKLAFTWWKKAADAEGVKGMALAGNCLVHGVGVEKNRVFGATLITMAAERGSDAACYSLGQLFAKGARGFPKDTSQAIRWFRKTLSGVCSHEHLADECVTEARLKLQELEDNITSSTAAAGVE